MEISIIIALSVAFASMCTSVLSQLRLSRCTTIDCCCGLFSVVRDIPPSNDDPSSSKTLQDA